MVHKIHGSRMYEVRTLHKKVMRHQGQVRPRFEKAEVDDHTPRSEGRIQGSCNASVR